MTIAIFPGSFDPITNGHVDIIRSASKIFDKIIVAVSYNVNKKGFLTLDTRKDLIIKSLQEFNNVEVKVYTGLTVDYAKKVDADVIVRGLRNSTDFEYEKQMSEVNSSLNDSIQTVFFLAKPEFGYISSSVIREILQNNGDISNLVPKPVSEYLVKS